MIGPARLLLASAVLASAATTCLGQINLQPTPPPIVTAENETWYLSGEPLSFAGNLYYPAGPAIHFLANEMVRSGSYLGVPLYSRTTIEPYSVVFVPAGRGMMQPYERRRDGDLAGTTGSAPPALPTALSVRTAGPPLPPTLQAAAPPVLASPAVPAESVVLPSPATLAASATPARPVVAPEGIATGGRAARAPRSTRVRPRAANGIYVEFGNARWFSTGPPVLLDVRTLTPVGESHGFPVYAARAGDSTIYVPVAEGMEMLAPYSRRN